MLPNLKGYIYAAIAAAAYGTNPIFAIPLYGDGMDVTSVLVLRYAMAMVIMFLVIVCREKAIFRHFLSLTAKDWLALVGMGVLMVMSSILLFESYRYLSAGIASTLLFCYPVIVALIMSLFYGERLSPGGCLCLVVAFLGVAALSKDDDGGTISLYGMMLVMLSSLSYAIYLIYIKRGPMRSLPSSVVTMVVLASGFLFLVLQAMGQGGVMMPVGAYAWLNVIGLGLLPTVVSLCFTSLAIQEIGSTTTAIFGALEPLTAVCLGLLVLDETLTLRMAVGMVMIFVSVTFLMMNGSRQPS